MSHFNRKFLWLALVLLGLEGATWYNLFGYYGYHEPVLPALLLATVFSALLIGSSILAADDVGLLPRALLVLGVAALFALQGIANCSQLYVRGQFTLPAELGPFWGTSADGWLTLSSFIYGLALNVVGLMYWIALSFLRRRELQKQRVAVEELENILNERR